MYQKKGIFMSNQKLNNHRLSVSIPDKTLKELDELMGIRLLSKSVIVQLAIEEYYNKYKTKE